MYYAGSTDPHTKYEQNKIVFLKHERWRFRACPDPALRCNGLQYTGNITEQYPCQYSRDVESGESNIICIVRV